MEFDEKKFMEPLLTLLLEQEKEAFQPTPLRTWEQQEIVIRSEFEKGTHEYIARLKRACALIKAEM